MILSNGFKDGKSEIPSILLNIFRNQKRKKNVMSLDIKTRQAKNATVVEIEGEVDMNVSTEVARQTSLNQFRPEAA